MAEASGRKPEMLHVMPPSSVLAMADALLGRTAVVEYPIFAER
jgi:hypothetical protein